MRFPPRLIVAVAGISALLSTGACDSVGAPDSRAAAAPVAAATAAAPLAGTPPRGHFAVGERHLRLARGERQLPVTIWYPKATTGRYPVVLFSHGLGSTPGAYAVLIRKWAAAGFVVAAPAYPNTKRGVAVRPLDVLVQPVDASFVLDRVLALDATDGDVLQGRLDLARVAAAGHSAGAITTVEMFTLRRDPRLRAGVVLAGSTLGLNLHFSGPAVPMLFVHGKKDTVLSYAAGRAAFQSVPWPKAMLTLPQGTHSEALHGSDGAAFRAVDAATVDFLRWSLYRDQSARARLDRIGGPDAVLQDQLN